MKCVGLTLWPFEGKYRNRVVTDKAFEEHLSEDIIVRLIN
jgi:hypothetical protein